MIIKVIFFILSWSITIFAMEQIEFQNEQKKFADFDLLPKEVKKEIFTLTITGSQAHKEFYNLNVVNKKFYSVLHEMLENKNYRKQIGQAVFSCLFKDIHPQDWLLYICEHKNEKRVNQNNERKINLNLILSLIENSDDINKVNQYDNTPLYLACSDNDLEMVTLLLKYGADINKYDCDGCTPLYIASRKGYREIVELLLENGADITIVENFGWAPLVSAVCSNQLAIVELLLNYGADINKSDKMGLSVLNLAMVTGHEDIASFLENYQPKKRRKFE